METIGIIIGVIVALILLAVLITWIGLVITARNVQKRADKYLSQKGEEAVLHIGKKLSEKYLDKK
jgi:flagellar biosynthesis/type III secretory pathway M-ring protein FliF/YscJ